MKKLMMVFAGNVFFIIMFGMFLVMLLSKTD